MSFLCKHLHYTTHFSIDAEGDWWSGTASVRGKEYWSGRRFIGNLFYSQFKWQISKFEFDFDRLFARR